MIHNNLTESVEAKLENTFTYPGGKKSLYFFYNNILFYVRLCDQIIINCGCVLVWDDRLCLQIPAGRKLAIPLSHAHSHIWIRPMDSVNLRRYHAFSSSPLSYMSVLNPRELIHEVHQCPSNRDKSYRLVTVILIVLKPFVGS